MRTPIVETWILLISILPLCKALMSCSTSESCTELQHQRCVDTDGDSELDTCLCEAGYFLKVATCAPIMSEGQDDNPCDYNRDLCKNGGQCRYNRDLRITECDCPPGVSGNTCEISTGPGSLALVCGPGYYLREQTNECLPCDSGYYLREQTNECLPCEVGFYKSQPGTANCTQCPIGEGDVRLITRNTTSVSREQCTKKPSIHSFIPSYGPLAGGTVVNISVVSSPHYARSDITEIKIARVKCEIQANEALTSNNMSSVSCKTAAVPEVKSGTVNIKYKGLEVESSDEFNYKEDPIITNLTHTKTILVGGLTLTVLGDNLDSVYTPIFEITKETFAGGRTKFETVCTVISNSRMECPIPNLVHGGITARKVDPQKSVAETPPQNNNVTSGSETPQNAGRRKRELREHYEFNSESNHFWMGFRLDGVNKYRNVTDMFGELLVYPNPMLERLHEEQHSVYYFDHARTNGNLQIKGYKLTYAATKDDYTVQVGVGYCNITNLYSNALDCLMPAELPAPGVVSGPHNSPQVIVTVGNVKFVAGFITYTTGPSGQVILGVVIGVIAVLIVVCSIATCLIIRMRNNRRKNSKNVNLETSHSQNPNIYSRNNTENGGRYMSSHSNGYLQPINERTPSRTSMSSGNSLAPLVMQMPNGHHEARSNRSASHGSINLFMDSSGTPTTPTTPNITQNVAYQIPRHNSIPFDIMDEISEDLKLIINECRVDSSRLSLKDSIGKGFFGKVYRGTLKDTSGKEYLTVAIKTVQGKECTVRDVEAFLAEAIVMKDFDHPNVINLLGVVIAGNRPFAILPYMEHGDLKSYISEPDRSIKVRELLGFGVQVAAGMEYLANQKIVHRDLATRNCMINKSLIVRIADFGLSRDIYKSDYYRVEDKHRPLPVKWMAIESLTSGVFTSSSDVWSFGVLLWELLTRGCSPYPDIDTFNLKTYLLSGRRLPQPEHAPDNVYGLMYSCWEELSEDRPTFEELHKRLEKIVEEEEENQTPEYLKLI